MIEEATDTSDNRDTPIFKNIQISVPHKISNVIMKKLELTLGSGDNCFQESKSTFIRKEEKNIVNNSNLETNFNKYSMKTKENCIYFKKEGEYLENSTSGIKFDNFMIKKKRNINIEITNYYDQKENVDINILNSNASKNSKSLKFTKNQMSSKSGFLPKLLKANF